MEEVEEGLEEKDQFTEENVEKLLKKAESIAPTPRIDELMAKLSSILSKIRKWKDKVLAAINEGLTVEIGEKLLKEVEDLPVFMPSANNLKETVKKANEWITKVDAFDVSVFFLASSPSHSE